MQSRDLNALTMLTAVEVLAIIGSVVACIVGGFIL